MMQGSTVEQKHCKEKAATDTICVMQQLTSSAQSQNYNQDLQMI